MAPLSEALLRRNEVLHPADRRIAVQGKRHVKVYRVVSRTDPLSSRPSAVLSTSGVEESVVSKLVPISAAQRAYGIKSFEYLRTVIYLVGGKINIALPTQC